MTRQCTTSLDPYLGTYRIVWDSESNFDPRDPCYSDADLRDGVLILTRPQRAEAWPKEPTPSSAASVAVLNLCDTFLGIDRAASKLRPSVSSSPPPSPSSSLTSSASETFSLSPGTCPEDVARTMDSRSTSTSTRSSRSGSGSSKRATRFWRFDWDLAFPRLGFRFEGMDMTATDGHMLSFSDILDDRGYPFAVLELRPAGYRGPGRDPYYITVVAKRQRDRYARVGLSEEERTRLGMIDLVD